MKPCSSVFGLLITGKPWGGTVSLSELWSKHLIILPQLTLHWPFASILFVVCALDYTFIDLSSHLYSIRGRRRWQILPQNQRLWRNPVCYPISKDWRPQSVVSPSLNLITNCSIDPVWAAFWIFFQLVCLGGFAVLGIYAFKVRRNLIS